MPSVDMLTPTTSNVATSVVDMPLGKPGYGAPPARKLYIFKSGGGLHNQFHLINHPGLPIMDLPKEFNRTGWSNKGSILDLPVHLHPELARVLENLNQNVSDGPGWVFVSAETYPGAINDGKLYYAAVIEKSGPVVDHATKATTTDPAGFPAIDGPNAEQVATWYRETAKSDSSVNSWATRKTFRHPKAEVTPDDPWVSYSKTKANGDNTWGSKDNTYENNKDGDWVKNNPEDHESEDYCHDCGQYDCWGCERNSPEYNYGACPCGWARCHGCMDDDDQETHEDTAVSESVDERPSNDSESGGWGSGKGWGWGKQASGSSERPHSCVCGAWGSDTRDNGGNDDNRGISVHGNDDEKHLNGSNQGGGSICDDGWGLSQKTTVKNDLDIW